MYEPAYYEQSRMSKAWIAATTAMGSTAVASSSSSSSAAGHMPLQAGLSNASNMSRHSQMTNYRTPITNRPVLLPATDRRPPPLVTSTPYTRQVDGGGGGGGGGRATAVVPSSAAVAPSNYQRNTLISASARFPRDEARAYWRPPQPLATRQPVVAFKQTPTFYEPQSPTLANSNVSYFGVGDDDLVAPVVVGGHRSGSLTKRHVMGSSHGQHHQSSSGGDSCCSSCCSLSNTPTTASALASQQQRQQVFRPSRKDSCESNLSCSSSCSCCSCQQANSGLKSNKVPAIVVQHHNHQTYPQQPQKPQPQPIYNNSKPLRQYESKTLTRPVRNRAERRRTVGAVSPNDLLQAQAMIENAPVTPTPGTPPSAIYSNEATFADRRSRTPISMTGLRGGPGDTHTTSSRDSGIGATTPGSQTYNTNHDVGLTAMGSISRQQQKSATLESTKPPVASSSAIINAINVKSSSESVSVRNTTSHDSSGTSANQSPAVGKTIAIAGDAETRASTTIYATTVQGGSSRSRESSVFLRLDEIRTTKVPLSAVNSGSGSFATRNSSFSSSASSSSAMKRVPPPSFKVPAGGQVAVGREATRCLPAGKDCFYWVDGDYDEEETSIAAKTNSITVEKRQTPVPAVSNIISSSNNNNNSHPPIVSAPTKQAPPTPREQSTYSTETMSTHRSSTAEKHPPLTRKPSFFRNILSSLFGIRPRVHSDADADVESALKKRRPANRSASAVFGRSKSSNPSDRSSNHNTNQNNSTTANKNVGSNNNNNNSNTNNNFSSKDSNKSSAAVSFSSTTDNRADRNRTWHGIKANKKQTKQDMRNVFDGNSSKSNSNIAQVSIKDGNNENSNNSQTLSSDKDEDMRSVYTSLSKDDGSSTIGGGGGGASSTLPRPLSRGTSLAGTLKSNSSSQRGPLFLVKRRGSSIEPVPRAAPGTTDPSNPTGEPAVIANVEQLLAMARVHPTLEYEWIPDDYFI